jgi:peptidoglycan/xylan/chitin deacetylase (PgdA/CDA1 family)
VSVEPAAYAVVLMYHRVAERPFAPDEGDYVVPPEVFVGQMDLLAAEGRKVVLPSVETPSSGDAVVLTFDDGCASDVTTVLPELRARDFRAAFFVNPERLGAPGFMSGEDLRALADAGMVVGSHGLDHTLLDDLPEPELVRQLQRSRELLERRLGRPVEWLSLPGGTGGARAVALARRLGYRLVFGSRPGRVDLRRLPDLVPRFAVRRGHAVAGFRAIVEQRRGPRLRAAAVFQAKQLLRSALGGSRYARWRRLSLGGGPEDGR